MASWLFKILGKDGATQMGVDTTHLASRVSLRPTQLGSRGSYIASFVTGILSAALGANSEIFQFRFVHATFLALPRRIMTSAAISTTAFAAGVPPTLEARLARSWTVQGTLGTGITWGANDGKKRTNFGTTVLGAGDVRIATTVALGAGTKTLDGTPFGSVVGNTAGVGGTAPSVILPQTALWERDTEAVYPIGFLNNEGFVIRSVQVPATGTWTAAITVEWDEIDPAVTDIGWS